MGSNSAILSVMFFALFFGIGLLLTDTPAARTLQRGFEGLFDVTMRLILIVIRLAPIAGRLLHVQPGGAVRLGPADPPVGLCRRGAAGARDPDVHRLSRAAGDARAEEPGHLLPRGPGSDGDGLLDGLVQRDPADRAPGCGRKLKLPRQVSRFVLTIGATANQNGTAMFEGVTVIFLAQFFGIDLSLGQQLMVMLVCILGGIGTAGVPAGSLPVVALILAMVGIDPQAIALVLGVDRFLDMCRTTLNVTGDLVAAQVISAREPRGEDGGPPQASQPRSASAEGAMAADKRFDHLSSAGRSSTTRRGRSMRWPMASATNSSARRPDPRLQGQADRQRARQVGAHRRARSRRPSPRRARPRPSCTLPRRSTATSAWQRRATSPS